MSAWTRATVRVPTGPPSGAGGSSSSGERPDPMAGRKLPPTPPSWWSSGEEATRSSFMAAQQLRTGSAPRRDRVADLEEELGIGAHGDIQAKLDDPDGG